MPRENYNDLLAFLAIAREGSFTRAAAQLGVSQSALSHTIRALEARLGVRLLTRTTRSVSVTQAGERLVESVGPRFEEIESELAALGQLKEKPAGSIRLTSAEHAANTVLWPKLIKLTRDYPEINVEICVDYGLTDIVAGRYDAGVRLGDQVAKDMIAVRIGPDLRMAVVGSESYLAGKSRPQSPADLAGHTCINLRLPTHGGLMAWEFERDGHLMKARVEGQWTFNSSTPILRAALSGFGLAYLPEDMVAPHVQSGALKRVMKSWTPTFPGYHLYYASRRHSSPAFRLLVEALRYPSRGKA
ncbi:MAG: LysR family transcriptional regulator [Herbaspirillum huttiense]|jgi:DNA-binding transcriptional LysR family regulator|uniref:LysR family transcriptional regulator n=2 Tax=Herbaspirillum huttiense TaxID=863372 RepID=UPI001ACF767E|nr:LysR family transcriptional regulator [Herbaspirillum huttiense]MBN9357567.1 LysR family transcriptional regulator [Herbaspirillum huttiense]